MSKKINIDTLRKSLNDASIPTELSEPNNYLSSGNYSLNYICTGNFRYALPNRRTMMLAGPQGTGKTFIASNMAKIAQDDGYFIAYIDTEHALDKGYLNKVGVDMSEDCFMPMDITTLEDAAKATSLIFQNTAPEDKVMLIVDSLANLDTKDELVTFVKKGELKNDMGLKSKKMKQLLKDVNLHVGHRDMFAVYTNHVYMNQDITNGKGKYIVNGGESCLFIPSITLMLDKKPLRADDAKETKDFKVLGLELQAQAYKTRFFRWMGKTEIEVPYDAGMNPLSGFLEFAKEQELVKQNSSWYSYKTKDGTEKKFQEGKLAENIDALLEAFDTKLIEKESDDDAK